MVRLKAASNIMTHHSDRNKQPEGSSVGRGCVEVSQEERSTSQVSSL